ncbi:hypothetical protein BpHYR1_031710, partial [Brachionus plicatilis]
MKYFLLIFVTLGFLTVGLKTLEFYSGLGNINQSCLIHGVKRYCLGELRCRSRICQCPSNSTWNGKYCERFGMSCKRNGQCRPQGLVCSSTVDGICQCPSDSVWDGIKCEKFGSNCSGQAKNYCTRDYVCLNETCQCPGDAVWDGKKCNHFNNTCLNNRFCSPQGLKCLKSDSLKRCLCKAGKWNGEFCDTFNATCRNQIRDKTCTRGLMCLFRSCVCPLGSWNITTGLCDSLPLNAICSNPNPVMPTDFKESFIVDRCDSSVNLKCNGYRCVCKDGSTLING